MTWTWTWTWTWSDLEPVCSVSNLLLHPIKLEQDTWPLFHH